MAVRRRGAGTDVVRPAPSEVPPGRGHGQRSLSGARDAKPTPAASQSELGRALPDAPAAFLEIGTLARPHGIRGELKLRLHFEHSASLDEVATLILDAPSGRREVDIDAVRLVPGGALVALAGLDSRDEAERLRGVRVLVRRAGLPPLGRGEFYLVDLVGARVLAPDGEVGQVIEVRAYPTVEAVVIRQADGTTIEQPLLDAWLEDVDPDARIIRLKNRDGLV